MRMQTNDIQKFRKARRGLLQALEVLSDLTNKYGQNWYFNNEYPFTDARVDDAGSSCELWLDQINDQLEEWPPRPVRKRSLTPVKRH